MAVRPALVVGAVAVLALAVPALVVGAVAARAVVVLAVAVPAVVVRHRMETGTAASTIAEVPAGNTALGAVLLPDHSEPPWAWTASAACCLSLPTVTAGGPRELLHRGGR